MTKLRRLKLELKSLEGHDCSYVMCWCEDEIKAKQREIRKEEKRRARVVER